MATTSLNVVIPPKKTQPAAGIDKLRQMSVANTPRQQTPKDQFISSVVNTGATAPDRTAMMGQLDTAKQQLLKMKEIADARVASEQAAKTGINGNTGSSGPSNSLKEMSSALSPRPTSPDFYGKANSAMEAYIKSLMPTDQETDVSKRLANMQSSISSGIQQASEQAIPMGFITGQQQAIENRGLNALQPLQSELERLFAQREAKSKGLDARQKFETALAGTRAEEARYQDETARDERRYAYEVAKEASAPIEFNGSLYQRNPDGGFTEILSAPEETPEGFELSEGQSRYEFNPKTGQYEMIANMPKTYKPESGDGGGELKPIGLSADNRRDLLGSGWSQTEIQALEAGVREYGLDEVIAQEKAAGATDAQIKALQKAYGSEAASESEQFLTKDYFKKLFGDAKLKEAAEKAGNIDRGNKFNPFDNSVDTEAYLTQLEQLVTQYRIAGYTDKEILKMMQ